MAASSSIGSGFRLAGVHSETKPGDSPLSPTPCAGAKVGEGPLTSHVVAAARISMARLESRNRLRSSNGRPHPHFLHLR